ncbi:MAG: amidohydrolase family protein [Bauldia sp.]|nr:amidohydrolase family protein [Bauldia sp.]
MEIIDGQVHLNHLGIDACIAAMDATGVDAAIIDQYPTTGERLAGGAMRYRFDISEEAVTRFPARFGYVVRIDPLDPDMEALVAGVRLQPGRLGIRIDKPSAASLAEGGYDRFLGTAMEHEVPVWITLPGRMPELGLLAGAFPDLQFIIDHAGVPEDWRRIGEDRFAPLDEVIALSAHSNVAVKWGHMTKMSAMPFPYEDVLRQLRRLVDAFGAHRVMWESDWTQCRGHETLAEMLFSIRLAPAFSAEEKEWLLGRSATTLMRWDRPRDKVDVVAIAESDWPAFERALASAGRLPHGGVRAVRMTSGEVPPDGHVIATGPIAGASQVTLDEAVHVMLNGRLPRGR